MENIGKGDKANVKTFLECLKEIRYNQSKEKRVAKSFYECLAEIKKFNPYHDARGLFSSGGVSATGANEFKVQGFASKQKLNNHWQNGRTHQSDYPGWTKEQYVQRAVELVQMPVGGDILGHKDKEDNVIRYDKRLHDFVKGHPEKGVTTLFKPTEKMKYYLEQREEDIKRGGKC